MKTFSLSAHDIVKKWHLIDATDLVLGRLAVVIADKLRGKDKATFSPHLDCGDCIVVVNAEKVFLTGRKRENKRFYWHTGHPGGIKHRTIDQILSGRFPERVIYKAVERMITKGPLRDKQMSHLKLYAGPNHPHEAQNPQVLNIQEWNVKNKKRA